MACCPTFASNCWAATAGLLLLSPAGWLGGLDGGGIGGGGAEAGLPGSPFCTLGLLSEIFGGLGLLTSCGVSMGTGDAPFRFTASLATLTLLSFMAGAVGGFASCGTGTAWPEGGATPVR